MKKGLFVLALIISIGLFVSGCGAENISASSEKQAVKSSDTALTDMDNGEAGTKSQTDDKVEKAESVSKSSDDKNSTEDASKDADLKTETKEEPVKKVNNSSQKYSNLSTWVAYWDYKDAIEQIDALGESLDTIVCFEALYGSDGKTILHPEGCDDLLNLLKSNYGKKTIYLSYTNDYQNTDGSYTQKSVDLLKAVFSSQNAMSAYAKDMVNDAKKSGVDGIELDYENMRKDESLFAGYAQFVEVLANECSANNLSFRVATEYQTGIKCNLINGPEYVVMCYNLYGYGTEPGPKADMAYLDACYTNFAYLDNVKFAFSLGGFKWNNGNVSAVTENEALALLSGSGAAIAYEPSGGAYFNYAEADGSASTVYYADANTINAWKSYLLAKGAKGFALWRLGGNSIDSLRGMR